MDSIRIAILSANNTPVAFMDNAHKKSMHYWDDELHEYLQGAANTYTFTVNAKHPDAEHVTVGNKVAFTYKGKSYYLNIVNTDQTEKIITATAWSLSFELINEDAGEYKAGKAMSFEEYLAVFDAERTLKLGLNEVSDKRITNEWTGTTSVLKRLFSLANVFSAEIEFETVLNRDYSLKEIVLNVYREHSDTDSGVGEYRNDIVLRYGKGITGIRKTTDVESLYTCIQPTGKDGLTINGLDKKEYDENGNIEYFTDGAIIRAPQARDRFPSNIVNKADAYSLMRKEYDTDSKDKLYSMALSDLKTASEPVVTYEVDGYFDTNIGDTVRMQDQEWTPVLYLQARVSEQVRSLTNPKTAKTVFTNYKELTSEISDSLLQRMQDLINKNKVYTCSISTNNGIIFKNGIGSTALTAYAYDNGVDVTGKLEIRWSKDGTEFYVGKSVTVNAEDVDVKAVYSFTAFESGVKRGYYEVTITDVMDGEDGQDGTTYYTWFKFADDKYGNGMSTSPDGKEYLGIAYNKVTPVMSNNPEDYQWARITGEGVPGKPGDDGKTYYTWVRYADDASGNGMSDSPNGKYYIGFAYNKEVPTESSNPTDYQWSKYKGDDGQDGTTYYTWFKFADDKYGNGMSTSPDGKEYLGIAYNKVTPVMSNNPEDYQWARITGEGVPGKPGDDGKTYYTWVRYADDASGNGMSDSPNGKYYIGFAYNKEVPTESSNPTDYQWSKYKGDDGQDGTTYYTWFKFADDKYGNGMSTSPDGKEYLGIAYNKVTPVMSNNPEDYQWARITGEGVPGKPGDDGKTYYTWVRYADDASGNGMSDSPNGKYYIGFAYNKEVPTESSNPTDYQWSKYKGDDGQDGVGIESITKYYLASEKSTGITISSSGWSTTKQDMTDVKKYLWSYEVYAYTNGTSTKTTPIIIGVHGQNGEDGTSGIIVSPAPPKNPKVGQLWQTASGQPIKRWDGSRWVLHYVSVENLDVQTLSAITVNAGELTAGKIKSKNGIMLIDIDAGKIVSKLIDNGVVDSTMDLNTASLTFSGRDSGGNPANMTFSMQGLAYINQNTGGRSKLVLSDGDIYAQNGNNPLIGLSSYSKYDSGAKQGPFPEINPSNSIRIKLIRTAFVVTCTIIMKAQFPWKGRIEEIQEVRIPDGYRPAIEVLAPISEVSNGQIFGTGRYIIKENGAIAIDVENESYLERMLTTTWITEN